MTNSVRIGLAQVTAEPYAVEENRELAKRGAAEAFAAGADIVVLPEMIVHGYVADWRRLAPLAEPIEGPTFSEWHALAREAGGYVVGGLCERDGDALYNAALAVGPEGLVLHYRKVHLFAEEKVAFRPGDLGFPVAPTRFGAIGICVCYDLRFVEAVRIMALRGADLVCVPTAWLPGFDDVRWDAEGMCPQAHGAVLQANLNQVFIACASQAGLSGDLDFLGSSVLADPYGTRALGPFAGSERSVQVVEVDIGATKRAQVRGPLIAPRADRRTDVYGLWTADGDVL
ncbi:MAG TPA: nitrilase-related carbon-nitrogen hydrolase [Gaiellaceae bacterium]|nr:nitrilase-related carbon-nitrogen hydrolase [Gaiellaceae bacterium]